MAHDARIGLMGLPSEDGIIPSYQDGRQWMLNIAAIRTTLYNLLGGAGVYQGGATAYGDLTDSGASYPASAGAPFRAVVADDSGYLWPFEFTADLAMTFNATSGACTAYLVIDLLSGVSPDAAVGGKSDASILVQLTADPAPANSLPLFTCTVAGSAVTADFVEDASARVAAGDSLYARRDLAETITPLWTFTAGAVLGNTTATRLLATDGSKKAVSVADLTAWLAGGTGITVADDGDGTATVGITAGGVGTTQLAAGAATYAKIQNVSAADKLLGRVTAGAGSIEEITCTAAGRAILDDADAAAQRVTLGLYAKGTSAPGSPSDGDLWYDTTNQILWVYNSTVTRWLQSTVVVSPIPVNAIPPFTTSLANAAIGRYPTNFDIYLDAVEITAYSSTGTWDASNKWDFKVYSYSTLLGTLSKTALGVTNHVLSVGSVIDTSGAATYLRVDLVRAGGTEGTLTDYLPVCMRYRLARR